MKKKSFTLATVAAMALSSLLITPAHAEPIFTTSTQFDSSVALNIASTNSSDEEVVRYSGSNRFSTAVEISKKTFSSGVEVAYIANGMDFPDALAGAAAAGTVQGPILLTQKNNIPAQVITELDRLQPRKIVILGGNWCSVK